MKINLALREESKPDSVCDHNLSRNDLMSIRPALIGMPANFDAPYRINASFGGYNRWDCPFHSHSSLLLSNSVNSEFVLGSACE